MGVPSKNINNQGFTLLELMVTVAIAAILVTMAVPSFTQTIRSNRLTATNNMFLASLNLARSEAIKRGVSVTVRRAGANWENGWNVFTDFDSDGNSDAGDGDTLLKTYQTVPVNFTLRGSNNFNNFINFASTGISNNAAQENFTLCDNTDGDNVPQANTSRIILVNVVGRARTGIDGNNDGIPNSDNANNAASNINTCTP